MRIALSTSLHLDHGARVLDHLAGAPLTMQAFVPIGLLSLKAACDVALQDSRTRVHELNTLINAGEIPNDDDFYDSLAQTVLGGDADLLGLMTDADSLHHTLLIAERVKARRPDIPVVLGGPAVTATASRVLERFPSVDAIVRGEGEITFPEYVAALSADRRPADVAGLTWRDGETVRHNPDRAVLQDLDALPIPDFDAYPNMSDAALYLDVGRGCPFKCAFCVTAPFWERRYRMKSIERILEEMQLLRDRWVRTHFNYSHDIFTCDVMWTHKFCDAVKAADLGVTWTCSTRTDVIDPDLLEHMAEAGCVEIYYGIETGSQPLQKTIDKNLDLDWSRTIVQATRAVGIRPVTGFIVGYPEETHDTLADTVTRFFDFLQVGGHRAHIFTLCPFPGAPMFTKTKAAFDRRAEYLDLPLSEAVADEANARIESDREIFASHYRFQTPHLDSALVDAAEEISPHLVVLKRIWPHLLKHYDHPVTFFRRWAAWICELNRSRPWRARHHGNAADIVDFIASELAVLGITDTRLRNLLRYEALKLAAAGLSGEDGRNEDGNTAPGPRVSAVRRASPFLIAAFDHDISSLLADPVEAPAAALVSPQWVVFGREPAGTVNTHVVGEAARRVLEHARTPRTVDDLVRVALLDAAAPGSPEFSTGLRIVEALTASRLLQEVTQ